MKNVLFAACAVVALSCTAASAAPWDGIYFGGTAGGLVGQSSSVTILPGGAKFDNNGPAGAPGAIDQNALFGGFVGANYQVGGWVLGVEGDISRTYGGQYVPFATTTSGAGPFTRSSTGCQQGTITGASAASTALATVTAYDCTDNLMWVATARGRVGYALGNMMIYGTGGFAWGSVRRLDQQYSVNGTGSTVTGVYSQQSTNWGWTAGLGIDYLATSNIVIGSDVVFVDLAHSGSFAGNGGTFATEKITEAFTMIRAKASYKFP